MTTPTAIGRDRQDNSSLSRVIPRAIEQAIKRLNTSLPGEIIRYDAENRRADVCAMVRLLTVDGETIDHPVIPNVPVVFPMSDTFSMTWPLHPGDPVLLVFSQRGIGNWKREHAASPPNVDSLLSERDAIAIPGLGPRGDHEPDIRIVATEDAITVQRNDNIRITFDDAGITIASNLAVAVNATDVTITGATTVNGEPLADQSAGTSSVAVGNHGTHSHNLTRA